MTDSTSTHGSRTAELGESKADKLSGGKLGIKLPAAIQRPVIHHNELKRIPPFGLLDRFQALP